MLTPGQFNSKGLGDVYFNGRSQVIPQTQWSRCNRLLLTIEGATKADDTKVPGSGFKQTGNVYSLAVDANNRIFYEWSAGQATNIDYV